MAIAASNIVKVNPRLLPPGASNLEFNGLILTKNTNMPVGIVQQYADLEGVQDYFGVDSLEASLASVYFLGYTNSFIKPRKLFFNRRIEAAVSAFMRGASVFASVEELQQIVAGNIDVTMSGYTANLVNIDLSGILTYSDVAVILQNLLQAETAGGEAFTLATVEYTSLYDAYIITNGTSGENSTISFASGQIATSLNLTEDLGALLSQGAEALSYAGQMESILDKTQNWVNFCTAWQPSEDEVLGFTDWAESKGTNYLYLYSDDSPTLLQPGNESTIAAALKRANAGSVAGSYSSPEYAVFLMAIGASIDWNGTFTIATAAFKSQQGLPATVVNSTDAANLISQGMNFIGDYATRNDNFIFQYPGQMFGDYEWIDTYWGAIWINNELQAAIMNGLTLSTRTPYNERGYTLIRSWCQDPINRGLRNGVIDTGVVLSESQKEQIRQEVLLDVSQELYNYGYYLSIKDPGASARVGRESPEIRFYFTYGGSVHRVDVSSTQVV